MGESPGDAGPGASHGRAAATHDDEDFTPPPARPELSDQTRPPVFRPIPPPRTVTWARALWFASFAFNAVGVLIAFLSYDAIRTQLRETLLRVAPNYDETSIEGLVDTIFWSSLAILGIVLVLEAVLLGFIMNRRGGARWLQLPVLVVHAGAVLVGSAFLAVSELGVLVEPLLISGFLLAGGGWILELLRPSHRWFRLRDESQAARAD